MDSGTLALWLVGATCICGFSAVGAVLVSHGKKLRIMREHLHEIPPVRFAHLECRVADEGMRRSDLDKECTRMAQKVDFHKLKIELMEPAVDEVKRRTDELAKRVAGVEALLVSTVGQETEDFCRTMDAIMDRMEKPEEKQEPEEKLTLSKEYCGKYSKKGAK